MTNGRVREQAVERRRFKRAQIDAWRLYQLVMNRAPESQSILNRFAESGINEHAQVFFSSEEFLGRVVAPLLRAERVKFVGAPGRSLAAWASNRLQLTDAGRLAVKAGWRNWASLYYSILTDEAFATLFETDHPLRKPAFHKGLWGQARFLGQLDEAHADRVRGWIAPMYEGGAIPRIEVWINGAFAAAGRVTEFRRDVQDVVGGDGRFGFEIPLPTFRGPDHRPLDIRVREAGGFLIGSATIDRSPPSVGALTAMASDLNDLKRAIKRLELQMPVIQHQVSSLLEDYGVYHDRWLRQDRATPSGGAITILVDAVGCPPRGFSEAFASLDAQLEGNSRVVLFVDEALDAFARDACNRSHWQSGRAALFKTRVVQPGQLAAQYLKVINKLTDEAVVLMTRGDVVLERDAMAQVLKAMADAPQAEALYGDHDSFVPEDLARDVERRRRCDPVLKPAFDRDLFLQRPYVGETVAFRAGTLRKARLHEGRGGVQACSALLGIKPSKILHLNRILSTVQPPTDRDSERARDEWACCVAQHLSADEVRVETYEDILGAQIPGAVRVRHPVPPGVRATIIIPTRDRNDLIRPCVESILAQRDSNETVFDVLVIDHENTEPEAVAYLAACSKNGDIRKIPYAGAFNWALMNNLAVAETDADVLIFLNDDTVVISPDWIDELVSQALRPDVGVVGCRLIYEDGAIQHAGFVLRETETTFLIHDGVGVSGSTGGYLGRHALLHRAVAVTGACMAVSRDVFLRLGGFDAANFPIEANDVDLCFRAGASGLLVLYDPYVTLYHLESKTRGFNGDKRRRAIAETAMALLWDRWGSDFGTDPGYNMTFDRFGRPFQRLRPPTAALTQSYP